jgi:hypothetical protein
MLEESDSWLGLLAIIGVFAALALGLVGLSGAVWLMIWPVERRARAAQGKFRFRLIDLGCLLVYWQVIMAALVALGRGNTDRLGGALVCCGVVFCGVSALTWSVCVGVLSRAGIESSACRAAFILVSIPGAIVASVTFVTSGMAVLMGIYYLLSDSQAEFPVWLPAIGFVVSSGAIFLLRLVSLWIAADARAA